MEHVLKTLVWFHGGDVTVGLSLALALSLSLSLSLSLLGLQDTDMHTMSGKLMHFTDGRYIIYECVYGTFIHV